MIKKIKEFFKKEEISIDYGALTEEHLKKYYGKLEPHPYKRMFSYAMGHKKLFIPSFTISIFYTIINILPPFFGQMAIAITGGKRVDILDKIPFVNELFSPVVSVIPLQMLALLFHSATPS